MTDISMFSEYYESNSKWLISKLIGAEEEIDRYKMHFFMRQVMPVIKP